MIKPVVKRKRKVLFEKNNISYIFIRNIQILSIQNENILKDINFTCAQLKIFNFRKVEIYATEFFKFSPNLLLIWKWECASNPQETKLSTCEHEKQQPGKPWSIQGIFETTETKAIINCKKAHAHASQCFV